MSKSCRRNCCVSISKDCKQSYCNFHYLFPQNSSSNKTKKKTNRKIELTQLHSHILVHFCKTFPIVKKTKERKKEIEWVEGNLLNGCSQNFLSGLWWLRYTHTHTYIYANVRSNFRTPTFDRISGGRIHYFIILFCCTSIIQFVVVF